MYRYVFHSWEPTENLEGDRWVAVLCPPDATPEMSSEGQCSFRVGDSLVTITAMSTPFHGWSGPAFEVSAEDDFPASVMSELLSGMWDRFSQAATRTISMPGGGTLANCCAQLLTEEVPAWAQMQEQGDSASGVDPNG